MIFGVFATLDETAKGMSQSGGVMVSYVYDPTKATSNQEHDIAINEVQTLPLILILILTPTLAAAAEATNTKEGTPHV